MKKFFIILFVIIILLISGIAIFIYTNKDKITLAISKAVESATGQPLYTDSIPSLSFFPTPGIELGKSSWGNPDTNEISVELIKCVFRFSLLKLFTGTIAIDEIFFEQPSIIIQKKNAQNKKIQSTAAVTSTNAINPQEDKKASFQLPEISISSVTIKDGMLKFFDGRKQIILTGLQLTAKNIYPQSTGKISIHTQALFQPENISFVTEGNVSIILDKNILSIEHIKFIINPKTGLTVSTPITIEGNGRYLFDKNLLEKSDIQVKLDQFKINANGSLELNKLQGTAVINASGSLKKLASTLGMMLITPETKIFENFSAQSKVQVNGQYIQLTDLKIMLDDSQVTGKLALNLPNKLSGNLSLTTINLDQYLPISFAKHTPVTKNLIQTSSVTTAQHTIKNTQQQTISSSLPTLDLKLTADSIIISKLHIEKLNSQLHGNPSNYVLDPCTFIFYESPISVKGKGNLTASNPRYEATITGSHINLTSLLSDISKTAIIKKGTVDLSAEITTTGSNSIQLKQTLNGKATIEGKDINIQFGALPVQSPELTRISQQPFTELNGKLKAVNGTINIEQFILKGTPVAAAANGSILLPNNTMKINVDIAVKDTVIPLHIYGDLSNPSYRVDPARLLQGAITKILNKKEKDIFDKLPLPQNAKESIQDTAEKVFNKIFGR
ncbi:asmA protein [Lawsonia intracellularis]|uniref:AsmA family protein n=1 Tax=Lawsonia intracellularis TaxID=29546 RepID=UPI00097680DF|nr:AsmA family protein [Lawsonia intracellularis]OMQ04541.1 asmA protein [Lawsonia intracellularis]